MAISAMAVAVTATTAAFHEHLAVFGPGCKQAIAPVQCCRVCVGGAACRAHVHFCAQAVALNG